MNAPNNEGNAGQPLRVAIVGSGPAGFYTAMALLKQKDVAVEVDVFDRLPTPYGLVRGGVAPDHQHTKSVIRAYAQTALLPDFRFFGNVMLGRDITVADLAEHYHQIVYAVGNEKDRQMGIPGEDLPGVTPATAFVGWYNSHPDYRDLHYDVNAKRIAVVGIGNVAVDVMRILAKTVAELAPTDMAQHALEALGNSRAEDIFLLGRRGPVQAAFTPTELEELAVLPHAAFLVDRRELELDPASRAVLEAEPSRSPVRRNLEILGRGVGAARKQRNMHLRFCVSPVEVLAGANGRVRALKLEHNELVDNGHGKLVSRGTGRYEELEIDWVFVSIGYRGQRIPGVPFDERAGIIPNRAGRVLDGDRVVPNQYVVGWAKTGPQGLIGPHKKASAAVVETMLQDARDGSARGTRPGSAAIGALLHKRGIDFVSFADWQRIDAAEIERGRQRGAPRVKFSSVEEILELLERPAAR